jgi:hypothetical protein
MTYALVLVGVCCGCKLAMRGEGGRFHQAMSLMRVSPRTAARTHVTRHHMNGSDLYTQTHSAVHTPHTRAVIVHVRA